MLKIERHNYILNKLKNDGSVLISDLSAALNCHEETIRRDLKELEASVDLKRIYGGAYLDDPKDSSVPAELRGCFFKDEKKAMGQAAMSYINPGDTIMLDSSTTCLQLAECIINSDVPLTLITNSLQICSLCASSSNTAITLVCLGGQLRQKTMSFVGCKTVDMLSANYAAAAFFSNPAIDIQFGLSDTNLNESQVRKCMLQHSKKHIFLMDHTKFSKISDNIFGTLRDIDTMITDQPLPAQWETALRENDILIDYAQVFTASEES